jgi:hypothetical protein
MRLAHPRPTSQTERLYALEEGRRVDGERLGSIETKVNEMHDILVAVRNIGRFLKFLLTWFGGPSAVAAAALYGWKFFTGH